MKKCRDNCDKRNILMLVYRAKSEKKKEGRKTEKKFQQIREATYKRKMYKYLRPENIVIARN